MRNLFAYADQQVRDYPGYVSLNEHYDGTFTLTVRSPGDGGRNPGTMTLTLDQLRALRDAIEFDALGLKGLGV